MEEEIINWAKERGIINGKQDQPVRQLLKCTEELGELCRSELESDYAGIVDGIGDVCVTLIIYAHQKGKTIENCIEIAYQQIKNRKGRTVNGTFIKNT